MVGLDASDEALAFAKARGVTLKKGSVENLPFKDGSFNLVVSVDVIYHNSIKSDLSAIKEFFRVLKPEGILIMRVPANKWLSLAHDRHVHTRERYQLGELNKKVLKAGFEIQRSSYINMVLLPIAIIKQFVEKLSWSNGNAKSEINSVPSLLNNILLWALNLESHFFKFINLPFGLGIIVVAKKV